MGTRLGALIIGGAVVAASAAIGVALWAALGLSWPLAGAAAAAACLVLFFAAARTLRSPTSRPARAATDPVTVAGVAPGHPDASLLSRIEAVEAGLRTVAQRVWEIDQRVTDLDRQVVQRSRDTVEAVANELDMVGSVVRDLAEAVALHDAELFSGPAQPSRPTELRPLKATRDEPVDSRAPPVEPPVARIVAEAAAAQDSVVPPAPSPAPEPPPPARTEPPSPREASNTAKRAVVTGVGVDLFLQSIVTLPQRKVRLYEALPRVKEADGPPTEGDDLAEIAWRLGVGTIHDAAVLRQVVKVIRHLAARERDVALACPVALSSLADRSYFELLSDLASEGQAVGSRLVLRLRHDAFVMASPAQIEAIEAVRALGVRLLIDGVEDLRIDPHALARRGIRFIKVPAPLLLAAAEGTVPAEIHPADLAGFLTRQGVAMIVSEVSAEDMALELMDFGATLGQGDAFAGPRPVRQEVILQDPPPLPAPAPTPGQGAAPAPSDEASPQAQPQRASLRSFLRRTTA